MAASYNPAKPFVFLFILVVLGQICNADNYGYVLYSDQTMSKYDTLTYGNYTLQFKYKCRLVLSDTNKQIWTSSNHPTNQPCNCMFEENGNLKIRRGVVHLGETAGDVLWEAIKYSLHPAGHYVLILQKDRNLVIYGPVLWQSGTNITQMHPISSNNERYVLYVGETINPGESLKNGRFSLVMQKDCNLVLFDGEAPLWYTKTADINNDCMCKLKSDGNLVVYKTSEIRPIWSAMGGRSSNDEGHYVVVLQSNGNLAIYNKPIWATGTHIVKPMSTINGFASINGSA